MAPDTGARTQVNARVCNNACLDAPVSVCMCVCVHCSYWVFQKATTSST